MRRLPAALLALLVLAALPAAPARAQNATEVLRFNMYWSGVPVGSSTLTARLDRDASGQPVRRFELKCRSNVVVDLFCKVRDRLASVAAPDFSRSLAYNKSLREGSERRRFAVDMDFEPRRCLRRNLPSNRTRTQAVPPNVLDPLSVFYAFRQRFKEGQERMAATVTDGLYTVEARARGLDAKPLDVPYGEFQARKVQICMPRVDGVFRASDPGCYFVWISTDGLPLKIQARVRVAGFLGDLSVELSGVERR